MRGDVQRLWFGVVDPDPRDDACPCDYCGALITSDLPAVAMDTQWDEWKNGSDDDGRRSFTFCPRTPCRWAVHRPDLAYVWEEDTAYFAAASSPAAALK